MSGDHNKGAGRPWSRREMLQRTALGFGAFAMTGLDPLKAASRVLGPTRPRKIAKHVIFLYMDGGVSQVDSFDPKPLLDKEDGKPMGIEMPATQFDDVGTVLKSPWKFKPGGECGTPVSDLFPHIRDQADKLAVVRSMTSNFSEHTFANYFLHTGSGFQGRPSMGAWWVYGLGSENENLPGYIVLDGGLIPPGGLDCFGSGFIPAEFQASVLRPERADLLPNLKPRESDERQRRKLDLLRELDSGPLRLHPEVEAAIQNQETAFLMQSEVPAVGDLSSETDATKRLYGLDAEYGPTRSYGRQCLLARRLIERGVRFVQLTCASLGHDRWDQHQNLESGHGDNARAVDQPIAGLLKDLESRGLLDETLVVFTGEFGRTPVAQGRNGRDHDPHGFSLWMAGAGVRGGTIVGATDDYGLHAVEDPYEIHDLHATMLHLMGIDHTKLTVRHDSRDMRLTDVHGKLIEGVIA
ncbi:MAG: DUF1501 domain-containing protein [Planctomycetota bacterium]